MCTICDVTLLVSDILIKLCRLTWCHAGTYPEKSILPAVGGNEGVAIVREVGVAVKDLCPGDHVIPALAGIGRCDSF